MSIEGTPLVSIMMPAYNVGKYIGSAIESTINQEYQNWELCICDDKSDDDTVDQIMCYMENEPRIRVTCLDKHRGCPTARNVSLDMCHGSFVARLDADDMHTPARLIKQVKFLQQNPKIDIVSTGYKHLWREGKVKVGRVARMIPERYFANSGGTPCNASVMSKIEVYTTVGRFNAKFLAGSDGDWNFRSLVAGMQWGYIDEALYYYRSRSTQLSRTQNRKQMQVHHKSRNTLRKQWQRLQKKRGRK